MSTELLPQRLKSVIAERDETASDIASFEYNLQRAEAKTNPTPQDRAVVVNISDNLEKYRRRLAVLDARIEHLSADLNSTENLAKRAAAFDMLESVKAKAPMRMAAHGIKIDGLIEQLVTALAERASEGAVLSKHAIDAITALAEGDPTALSRTLETEIPHLRANHSHNAAALATAVARFIRAADVAYSIGDFIVVNTSSVNNARTFAETADRAATRLQDRIDTVLESNGRTPAPTKAAWAVAGGLYATEKKVADVSTAFESQDEYLKSLRTPR